MPLFSSSALGTTTKQVSFPKDRHGIIIGRGGENINAIRSEWNVAVTVPKRDDPSSLVSFTGPARDVERAIEYVTEKVMAREATQAKLSKTDDLYARRGELFAKSKAAWNAGQKDLAKKYSDEAKALSRKADERFKKDQKKVFSQLNKDNGRDTIDLHGQSVESALVLLEKRMKSISARGGGDLAIVTGKGLHSDGRAKILPQVVQKVREKGLACTYEDGTVRIVVEPTVIARMFRGVSRWF